MFLRELLSCHYPTVGRCIMGTRPMMPSLSVRKIVKYHVLLRRCTFPAHFIFVFAYKLNTCSRIDLLICRLTQKFHMDHIQQHIRENSADNATVVLQRVVLFTSDTGRQHSFWGVLVLLLSLLTCEDFMFPVLYQTDNTPQKSLYQISHSLKTVWKLHLMTSYTNHFVCFCACLKTN